MRSPEPKLAPGLAGGGELRSELGCVLSLSGLFGDSQHRSDFGPGTVGFALRIASSSAVSTPSRCSTNSAIVRRAAVWASTRSLMSTLSAHRSSASARCARVVVMVSTTLSGTWIVLASRE